MCTFLFSTRRLYASVASPVTNVSEKLNNSATIHQLSSNSALADFLKQLDDQVRRWGRVDKEHVQRLLDLVSKNGKSGFNMLLCLNDTSLKGFN